ncbi:hypothetical protein IRJ41_010660, partial [Triplophysa rosa]
TRHECDASSERESRSGLISQSRLNVPLRFMSAHAPHDRHVGVCLYRFSYICEGQMSSVPHGAAAPPGT